jgi:6-phosphogluconolactonase
MNDHNPVAAPGVYVQTNDAERNAVLAFERRPDGRLSPLGAFDTGGRGSGQPHLASQGSVVVSGDALLVANAGSDDVSVFAIEPDGLRLTDRVASGGRTPTSVAVAGDLVYVLDNGSAEISGFRLAGGRLVALEGSRRQVGADPAQIAFGPGGRMLAVTERGTDSISTFAIDAVGYAVGPVTVPSSGQTPYGFDFTADGALIVTEAFGGAVGKAAASSYAIGDGGRPQPVSASVADTRSEVCWAAVTRDSRFAYVTNFGDGTISSYAIAAGGALSLRDAVAASTRLGEKGVRDEAITGDGSHLFALDADARRVFGWRIGPDGELTPSGSVDGLPATAAGLAAS